MTLSPRADPDRTEAAVRQAATSFPGTFVDLTTYLHERIDETISNTSQDLVVRILGPDFGTLQGLSAQVTSALGGTPHLIDLHRQPQGFIPQIQETVNASVAARYGLTPGEVRRDAATLLGSVEVGEIATNGVALGVSAYSTPATRQTLSDVSALLIDTPSGGTVPLGKVASLVVNSTPSDITRIDGSNKIDVDANVAGDNLGAATSAVQSRLARVRLPVGYHIELLGEGAERQAAQNRMLAMGIGAAIAILFLLQAAFQSVRLATLLFLTLPVALVGGVLAAWIAVGTISLGALVGFFAVLGIAARNGILMISHLQHLEREEGEPFGLGLVMRGASERLSPILMTALATALALSPLVIFGDRPGQEIEYPMAIVILGGLATSTAMNLFVLPAL
jgi:Cu/Ag efflux pump CusA